MPTPSDEGEELIEEALSKLAGMTGEYSCEEDNREFLSDFALRFVEAVVPEEKEIVWLDTLATTEGGEWNACRDRTLLNARRLLNRE